MMKSFIAKHPYAAAVLAALICTVLTAVGSAAAQIAELADIPGYLAMSAAVACSILIGFLIIARSGQPAAFYGFRRLASGSMKKVWLVIPLLLLEIVPLVLFAPKFPQSGLFYTVLALFTLLVGLNEELYFRGLVFHFLRQKGPKAAVIGSAIIFGILHAVNALSGTNPWAVLLQVVFAFLVGLVLALIVSVTKSLWIGILWHTVHNFISFSTESSLDQTAITVIGIQVVIMLIYAVGLWRAGTRNS